MLAQRKSSNWHTTNLRAAAANQLLMLIEYATANTQTAIGAGVTDIEAVSDVNCASLTGSTASLGDGSGNASSTVNEISGTETTYTTQGKLAVSYRGMENPWGNLAEVVQGINVWGNGTMLGGMPYIAESYQYNNSANSGTYRGCGFTLVNTPGGWVSAFGYAEEAFDWTLLPSEVGTNGANSALPVGDMMYTSTNNSVYRMAFIGNNYASGTRAGAFGCNYSISPTTLPSATYTCRFGYRLMYIPTAKGA